MDAEAFLTLRDGYEKYTWNVRGTILQDSMGRKPQDVIMVAWSQSQSSTPALSCMIRATTEYIFKWPPYTLWFFEAILMSHSTWLWCKWLPAQLVIQAAKCNHQGCAVVVSAGGAQLPPSPLTWTWHHFWKWHYFGLPPDTIVEAAQTCPQPL